MFKCYNVIFFAFRNKIGEITRFPPFFIRQVYLVYMGISLKVFLKFFLNLCRTFVRHLILFVLTCMSRKCSKVQKVQLYILHRYAGAKVGTLLQTKKIS